jgi:uncharacterized protein
MAFDDFEQGEWTGKPIHLFIFTLQTKVWRFATCDRDYPVGLNTYLAAPISRSAIEQTSEPAKDQLTITMAYMRNPAAAELPATQSLGDLWFPYAPSDKVYVTCLSTHFGDTDPPRVEWMGEVAQPKFNDVELELVCEPTNGAAEVRNQGAKFQRSCWKTVYSTGIRGCNLDPEEFKIEAELTAVDGLTATAPEFGASAFSLAGGTATWLRDDGIIERRSIMRHSGNDVVLLYGAADLAPALETVVLPGCPRTWAACEARNNTDNFGGAIYKPIKNPMDGVSMSWG